MYLKIVGSLNSIYLGGAGCAFLFSTFMRKRLWEWKWKWKWRLGIEGISWGGKREWGRKKKRRKIMLCVGTRKCKSEFWKM